MSALTGLKGYKTAAVEYRVCCTAIHEFGTSHRGLSCVSYLLEGCIQRPVICRSEHQKNDRDFDSGTEF